MIGCLRTALNTLETIINPPSRLLARGTEVGRHSGVHPCARTSGRWGRAATFLAMRPCVACHHIHLADDLAAFCLQRRFDHDPVPVRVLARLPERHPILADVAIPLDAVRRLLAEGRSQVLGYLRLSAELEGRDVRGEGVDDAQSGVLGVEGEHEVRVASLDTEAQGLEIQTSFSLPPSHTVCLLPPAPSGSHRPSDGTIRGRDVLRSF